MTTATTAPHIGLFDSGIGGLSVLRALRRHWPAARCSYIADTACTPWGDRSADWVAARCAQLSAWLIEQPGDKQGDAGVDLVLVACNTGTTQAIAALRSRWPQVPFVGVEPGIKPAVAASHKRRVAVMATSGTLGSARLRQLVDHHADGTRVLQLPCPGLVEAIERAAGRGGAADGHDNRPDEHAAALAAQLDRIAATLRDADVDTVVLGCTHYPLVADALQQRLGPGVQLIDTADAVVRRVVSLLPPGRAGRHAGTGTATGTGPDSSGIRMADSPPAVIGSLRLLATGDSATLQQAAQRWLDSGEVVERLALPPPDDAPDSKKPNRAPRA